MDTLLLSACLLFIRQRKEWLTWVHLFCQMKCASCVSILTSKKKVLRARFRDSWQVSDIRLSQQLQEGVWLESHDLTLLCFLSKEQHFIFIPHSLFCFQLCDIKNKQPLWVHYEEHFSVFACTSQEKTTSCFLVWSRFPAPSHTALYII